MESIEFRCMSCGNTVQKDLLPGKHTVLGTLPIVNKNAGCCGSPDYEDSMGYHRSMVERSLTELVPGLRA